MTFRYKQRRQEDQSSGGVDDWLMTYADMITLLLCFFAIFLSVSVPKKEIFDQARQRVMEKFGGHDLLAGQFPDTASRAQSGGNYNALPAIVDRYHQGEGQSIGDGIDAGTGGNTGAGEGERSGGVYSGHEEGGREYGRGEEDGPGRGRDKAPDGDRIKMIEMPSAAFFASGSAVLSEDGKALLAEILDRDLKSAEFQGFQITVEGHTDDVPISTAQFPSNWELSAGRAGAVVRFFIENGIPAQRLRVAGYADAFPKMPNRNEAGSPIPANQAQNRRVVIKLEKIEKAQ